MDQPTPLQFSLKTILAITAAVSLFFAAGAWFDMPGYVLFVLLGGLAAVFAFSRDFDVFLLGLAGYLLLAFALCCGLGTWIDMQSSPPAKRSICNNNLKQIGLALQNYADVYGCFPPAYVTDAAGKPIHSWRVLILPFIEQQALYSRYNFNEPWDGPNNSLLAKEMPSVFRCPANKANPGTLTDYVAIVGPETIWQANRGATFDEITDGSANTIAVVEAAGLGVNWMEPRDLPFSTVANGINPKQGPSMASQHPNYIIALFVDGHTQTIQQNISHQLLRAICTKDGCEEIDGDF